LLNLAPLLAIPDETPVHLGENIETYFSVEVFDNGETSARNRRMRGSDCFSLQIDHLGSSDDAIAFHR
jgi:hypothetical protein